VPKPPVKAYTFKTLKSERGWPYSRQHTHRLIKAGRFPPPKKAPGGSLNIWTDDQIDDYYASALTLPRPTSK
jgi:predicted DNA-binding transcriptional regulator AlpA